MKLDDISRKGIFYVIINKMNTIRLDISNIEWQSYDTESNMKGKYQGV